MKKSLALGLLLFAFNLSAQVTGNLQFRSNSNTNGNNPPTKAQTPYAVFSTDNSILVDINAIINVEADSYVAVFNVSQTAPTIEEVQRLTQQRIDAVQKEMASINGIEQIFVDMLSLVPVYELEVEKKIFSKNTYDELPAGFELQKNIHIRYQDPEVLDKLVLICGSQEIYDLVKVDYYVADFQLYYDTLRSACYEFLDQRLEEYQAKGMQMDTSRIFITENSDYSQPAERYLDYSAFITNTFQGKNQNSKLVHRQRKKVTQYYQPITYKGYDIVLHPEIVQPVLQFTFNMKAKYFLQQPESTKKEIYILSPEGTLKKVELE